MVQISFRQKDTHIFKNGHLPALFYAGQISDNPTWSFPSHKHDDVSEIIYISEGEGNFIINNQGYTARKGDILIYNRGVLHEERSNPGNPLKTYFCGIGQINIAGVEEGCIISANMKPIIPTGPYSRQIEGYISTIFEEIRSQVFGFETVCQNAVVNLLISILRIVNSQRLENALDTSDSLSMKIKEFIDINYTQDIPLNKIANRLFISPFYLSHIFKEETGFSPINYLIQRRIGESKRLLLTTDLTIQEIAERVGYDNSTYFSTLFKKVTGETPSVFRKSAGNIGGG